MLSDDELERWFLSLKLSGEAKSVIREIRSGQPVRAVGGRRSNVSGRYPSRKMGVTIQFESHRTELAAIHDMEHDSDVLEYYDQPARIPLAYENMQGRKIRALHTPDFLVLRVNRVGWEEWKTESDLESLSSKMPQRSSRSAGEDSWQCPPGVAFAAALGMYYRLRSSNGINWILQANIHFLEDYMRRDSKEQDASLKHALTSWVIDEPGILISELLPKARGETTADCLYTLIALGDLYVDLNGYRLAEVDRVRVFRDRETAEAFIRIEECTDEVATNGRAGPIECAVGRTLFWDGRTWKIINVGDERIGLLGHDGVFTELPFTALETLAREGRIQMFSDCCVG